MGIAVTPRPALGVEPEELASAPGLLVDLALSLLPRRVALARGLIRLLGPRTLEKVWSRYESLTELCDKLGAARDTADQLRVAREACKAMGDLEDALWGLLNARVRRLLKDQEFGRIVAETTREVRAV